MGTAELINTFGQEYFSGTQCSIYMGNVFVDDISNLSFEVRSPARPVYGYRSKNFDLILRENIIIVGAFSINYRGTGYLDVILSGSQGTAAGNEEAAFSVSGLNKKDLSFLKGLSSSKLDNARVAEVLTELKKSNLNLYKAEKNNLKGKYWGEALSSKARHSGFNWVGEEGSSSQKGFRVQGPFKITIGYGDDHVKSHNFDVINDVIIIGEGKTIDNSGRPIEETYQFLARNAI